MLRSRVCYSRLVLRVGEHQGKQITILVHANKLVRCQVGCINFFKSETKITLYFIKQLKRAMSHQP